MSLPDMTPRRKSMAEAISKIFHGKNPNLGPDNDDSASTTSTLVNTWDDRDKPKLMSHAEKDLYNDLMEKGKTMNSEEFKVYLAGRKEEIEAAGRNNRGAKAGVWDGVFGRGAWGEFDAIKPAGKEGEEAH